MVIGDQVATHLIIDHSATVPPEHRLVLQCDPVQASIVLNAQGLAFHELVDAFALLSVKGPFATLWCDHPILKPLGILAYFNPIALEDNGAFGHQDMPLKDRELLQIIVHQLIGLDVHGLVFVRIFTMGHSHGDSKHDTQRQKIKFQGTNLAVYLTGIVRAASEI